MNPYNPPDLSGYATLTNGVLTQSENPQAKIEDIRYVAQSSVVTGTRDGTWEYPFATIQDAINYWGAPTTQADFNRQLTIIVLDRAVYTEALTWSTRRYGITFVGGTPTGNWTININGALRFGSAFSPTLDVYSASRNLGTQIIGNMSWTLTGTTVTNIAVRLTNILWTGNVTIADGVNGGSSITTGTNSQFSMIGSSVTGTFLARNTGVSLIDSSVLGNTEMQALLSATGASLFNGTSITMYGTATTTRNISNLSLLSTGGVTWTNTSVEPRWNVDQYTLSQFTTLATVATNKIRFNVNVYAQATNDGASGAVTQSYHDSASPAANDVILSDSNFGRDSVANKQEYARREVVIEDPTNSSEDAIVKLYNVIAGAMTELVRYGSQSGVNVFNILGALQCDSIVNDTGLASGTYTPTLTNVSNIDASTAYPCQYLRVGNTVTVSGKVNIDPTSAGTIQLGISLPIASNFSNDYELAGTGASDQSGEDVALIKADPTNNRATFIETKTSTTAADHFFTFTYLVI